MRTRSRRTYGRVQAGQFPVIFESHDENTAVPADPVTYVSSITDEPKSKTIYHYVDHQHASYIIGGDLLEDRPRYYPLYLRGLTRLLGFTQEVKVPTSKILEWVFTHHPQLQDPFAFNASRFDNLYPRLVPTFFEQPKVSLNMGNFSLINFLLEWKDCVHMFRHYLASREVLNSLNAMRNVRLDPLQAARAVANEHLSIWFGLRLFVQDVTQLLRILSRWKHQADVLFDEMDKPKTFRFRDLSNRCHLQFSEPTETIPVPIFGLINSSVDVARSYIYEGHGSLSYNYKSRELVQSCKRLFQLLDSLGVNLDVGIAWDALPLSFVIDWFLPVGQYMHDNWSRHWFEFDLHLLDYCQSGKLTESMSIMWTNQYPGSTPQLAMLRTMTHYRRERKEIPPFRPSDFDYKKPWKLSRFFVAASLLLTRGAKQRTIGGPSFKKKDPNAPSKSKRAEARIKAKHQRLLKRLARVEEVRISKRNFKLLEKELNREIKNFEKKNKIPKTFEPRPRGVRQDNPFLRGLI